MHRVAFVADIEQMFRQIRVHPDDQSLQQIFWREDSSTPLRQYRLTTVTYGTACAPFLAGRTLLQLADDEQERFPRAAELLRTRTYVDDILAGAKDVQDAKSLQEELRALLKAGGFKLKKWAANVVSLLERVPEGDREPLLAIADRDAVAASVLGVQWVPASDTFGVSVSSDLMVGNTKRTILSALSRIFDPLGWLAPVVVQAKMLLQELWLAGVSWDGELPAPMEQRWRRFREHLRGVSRITIPRWTGWEPSLVSTDLHMFCDASERAYAATVYLVTCRREDQPSSCLLVARTKVAPVKRVTLPRLELCGALLGVRLLSNTAAALGLEQAGQYGWTDSTVVQGWLKEHPSRWHTFVANRVAAIHEIGPHVEWRHVRSRDNPADLATRGVTPADLQRNALWWRGPEWLQRPRDEWPTLERGHGPMELPEERRCHHAVLRVPTDWEVVGRAASFGRAVRTMAYVLRFARRFRPPCVTVSAAEQNTARIMLIRLTQRIFFTAEVKALNGGRRVSPSSHLSCLNPVLDEDGLLRISGRVRRSQWPADEQQQILLPRESVLTRLLVRDAHLRSLHGGTQLTLALVRREYWIPTGRTVVRGVLRLCVTCERHRASPMQPMMAPLPGERTTPAPPFTTTGVDYAGPVSVRASHGRGRQVFKGYIAVFVCFVTKAIHLELVSDYSASAFLAAFQRFMARRGKPSVVYSDRGTTFVGASRELKVQWERATATDGAVPSALAQEGIDWRFTPPSAPHFGGLWEAGVRSVKHHLRRVVGERPLSFEEYSTFLARIEACLNSRPLEPLSEDPGDLQALTPGHFLVGRPLLSAPEQPVAGLPAGRLSRWQLLQQLQEHLWGRWSREYLHQMQTRRKWRDPGDPPRKGELVVIIDDRLPPARWLLGRIEDLCSGPDGQVRVVRVRTADTILTRPVVKLVRLPVEGAVEDANADTVKC